MSGCSEEEDDDRDGMAGEGGDLQQLQRKGKQAPLAQTRENEVEKLGRQMHQLGV